jgi:YD repeat-containing protein
VDENVYNTTNDTLAERWHFGQKLMSYTFNAQGQLASFTDGRTKTTTLGSYKRGIPQAIGYPDGTSQSLVVDDFGQIRSITDQAGATTTYAYDAVGRLTRIDYPTGDEQAWYPKTFSYAFVTGAERGVGANHWRRTVAKGSQRQVTYFNAMLQPVLTDTYIDGNAGSHTSVRSDYDYRGLATFSAYPVAGTPVLGAISAGTTTSYDALGRPTRVQQTSELGTLTTTTAYLSGARKQVTDPKGNVTTTRYQVFDQPSYDAVTEVQAPAGVIQTITRDLYGNPTQIHQYGTYNGLSGDVTKTLVYDAYHRLCRTIEPESGSEVMAYDDANNLLWSAAGLTLPAPTTGTETDCYRSSVAEAGRTQRTYDAMNRLLGRSMSQSPKAYCGRSKSAACPSSPNCRTSCSSGPVPLALTSTCSKDKLPSYRLMFSPKGCSPSGWMSSLTRMSFLYSSSGLAFWP